MQETGKKSLVQIGKVGWVTAGLVVGIAFVLWAMRGEKPAAAPQAVVEAPPPPISVAAPEKPAEAPRLPPIVEESAPEVEAIPTPSAIDDSILSAEDLAAMQAESVKQMESDVQESAALVQDIPLPEEPTTPLEPAEFLAAVRSAISNGMDPVEVQGILARVPLDAELMETLQALAGDEASGKAMQAYAAEALVRAGTGEAMKYVLDELLAAYTTGDDELGDRMVAALEASTTAEGLQSLFDLLLKRGTFADLEGDLPPEVLAAARKALLSHPDRQLVGNMAADLYLDPAVIANEAAMWELFDGVSHPIMLSSLAARAYEENLPDNAAQFMNRLGQSDEQGVVQAVVGLALNPAVPVDDVSEALYEWSLAHPQDAMPGLFMEYMTDATLTPEQRTIAAYGLAGTSDPALAKQYLEKALAHEEDPSVRMDLQTALSLLEKKQP